MTTAVTGEAQTLDSFHDLLKAFALSAVKAYFPETDKHGNPNLSRFFFDNNGRLPHITDEIKPWNYRGWLVPYVQGCEAHPLVSPRYAYVMKTLDAGHLLDEPLPQIDFYGEFTKEVKPGLKMLNDLLAFVEYESGSWNGMREFCEWLGFALGVTHERSKLSEKVQEHLYRNFNLEPLLLHPSDYLGQMLCETQYGKKNGFYPTPIEIVKLMAQMVNAGKEADARYERAMDPCVGTGRMLLVASNYSMRLFGQDIDGLCCLITKINLALYAPWFYIPESFFGEDVEPLEREENAETTGEPQTEIKTAPAAQETLIEAIQTESPEQSEELSLFERLRIEKQNISSKKSKKHTTKIEEQISLF